MFYFTLFQLCSYSRQLLRRSSEGGLGSYEVGAPTSIPHSTASVTAGNIETQLYMPKNPRRAYSSMSGRLGTRSWHPSPMASDDDGSASAASDEPQFYKEEKKNRIKMEIARRRQQIEENACLHEELTRLAKLRESAENTTTNAAASGIAAVSAGNALFVPSASSGTLPTSVNSSMLKSVDEILRDESYSRLGGIATRSSGYGSLYNPSAINSTPFNSDLYTSSVYDRVGEFSPINDISTLENGKYSKTHTGIR